MGDPANEGRWARIRIQLDELTGALVLPFGVRCADARAQGWNAPERSFLAGLVIDQGMRLGSTMSSVHSVRLHCCLSCCFAYVGAQTLKLINAAIRSCIRALLSRVCYACSTKKRAWSRVTSGRTTTIAFGVRKVR